MFCPKCGNSNADDARFCSGCGTKLTQDACVLDDSLFSEGVSPKSRAAAFLFAVFFGCLGVHNFYTGHSAKGAVQLSLQVIIPVVGIATLGFGFLLYIPLAIWIFIEIILILCGAAKDDNGDAISKW